MSWIKGLFAFAALYDAALGVAFLFFGEAIFEAYGVTPPNHMGYVHFCALLLLVFAALFVRIAADPLQNRELILYGCGLKLAYTASVFWHQMTDGIPSMWIPWAWADLVMLALFVWAWVSLGRQRTASA